MYVQENRVLWQPFVNSDVIILNDLFTARHWLLIVWYLEKRSNGMHFVFNKWNVEHHVVDTRAGEPSPSVSKTVIWEAPVILNIRDNFWFLELIRKMSRKLLKLLGSFFTDLVLFWFQSIFLEALVWARPVWTFPELYCTLYLPKTPLNPSYEKGYITMGTWEAQIITKSFKLYCLLMSCKKRGVPVFQITVITA